MLYTHAIGLRRWSHSSTQIAHRLILPTLEHRLTQWLLHVVIALIVHCGNGGTLSLVELRRRLQSSGNSYDDNAKSSGS